MKFGVLSQIEKFQGLTARHSGSFSHNNIIRNHSGFTLLQDPTVIAPLSLLILPSYEVCGKVSVWPEKLSLLPSFG